VRLVLLAFLLGCSAAPTPTTPEGKLRARLGVPDDAKTIVIFQQAAHLDIDWQHTFDEYYSLYVNDVFTEAHDLLSKEPRERYSVTEMGFLKHHLAQHPEQIEGWRAGASRGAVHIVGGGITSPDTLLPETEMLFRDFLYGTKFAEDTLGISPTSLWVPDSFGHAATLPDVFSAAGFTSVGFGRIDGAPTFYETIKAGGPPPIRAGSSAEKLMQLGSADFVWRGPGGGELLGHWIASGIYCTGDNIDYDETLQLPGGHLGVYDGDQPGFTDDRIDEYVAALGPLAKTPYVFVPIGCDFQHPKAELISYLDGYNQRRFPKTKIWTVLASFDDYVSLVDLHRGDLPSYDQEISPYFMGFYASRAQLKRRVREAARPFFAAESFATALADPLTHLDATAFEQLTFADHHDFVTGTSKNEVVSGEQLPLLDAAEKSGRASFLEVAHAFASQLSPGSGDRVVVFNASSRAASEVIELPHAPAHADVPVESIDHKGKLLRILASVPPLGWRAIDLLPGAQAVTSPLSLTLGDPVILQNERVRAVFAKSGGRYALTSLQIDQKEQLSGPSFVVNDWADQGGLWRLGNEMDGCSFTQMATSDTDEVRLIDRSALSITIAFISASARREVRLDAGSDGLDVALIAAAQMGTTRTALFRFAPGTLRTGLAGGYAERVPEHVYTPTFWPAVDWLSVGGATILLRQSTGVRFSASGEAEMMAMRWAPSEQCDVEGGMGDDSEVHRIEWRLTNSDTIAQAAQAAQSFNRPVDWILAAGSGTRALSGSLISFDGDGVITALKPAERGEGTIVRALLLPGPITLHSDLSPSKRTDALERDLADQSDLMLDRDRFGPIATLRLR
jgi:hypothetical protein